MMARNASRAMMAKMWYSLLRTAKCSVRMAYATIIQVKTAYKVEKGD